ncbi:sterol esterase [Daedalea quercina L-15889]|uniref:Carboxylic ester hydrolase n=1 Tax=Daedalea quercina L-15889 TaxID=1314783 RepID=A0A165NRY3_9APHY|nr:sterol esterase [Daedalea quercina L-15889]
MWPLRQLLHFLLLGVSPVFCVPSTSRDADTSPTVTLDYGSYKGTTSGNITSFLGMNYAQPPVGSLRFAAPQEPSSFSGVVDATAYGAACPQQDIVLPELLPKNVTIASSGGLVSEDCLNINVIKPATASLGDNLPVLFWIFGGAFEIGDASTYDGSLYVQRSIDLGMPIIFVAPNYRVSAFGFIASQEILEANATNLGLRDQRLALQWVNKYISQFGGDPDKVTIWGESAGAFSVAAHLVWNDGDPEGLFRAAVMESGPPISLGTIEDGQPYYDQLVENTGCYGQNDTLSCLRSVDYSVLEAAIAESPSFFSYQSLRLAWQPHIDGQFILRNGMKYIQEGIYAKVPIIIGDCYDEGTLFSFGNTNITTDDEFLEYVQSNYISVASDDQIQALGEAYPSDPSEGAPYDTGSLWALTPQFKRLASFQGDWLWQAPRRYMLNTVSQTQDAWAYLYKRGSDIPYLGTAHALDILEFFSSIDYVAPDALIFFTVNLNPNAPADLPSGLSRLSDITWDQWGSDSSEPPLLTFVDPAPSLEITADTFRADALDLLNELMLLFP